MFKPTMWKLLVPIILVGLALLPSQILRVFLFETLAYPFGPLLSEFRYADVPYLNLTGVLLVAFVWAVIYYVAASLIVSRLRK